MKRNILLLITTFSAALSQAELSEQILRLSVSPTAEMWYHTHPLKHLKG